MRRHLSALKNGGLLAATGAGRVLTLLISDVVDGPASDIASGPTLADETTPDDARTIIEQRLGRAPDTHQQPRVIDLDILLFGHRRGGDDLLTLPHPRLAGRAFVLGPLAEVAPDVELPDSRETAAAAWARIRDEDGPWLRPVTEPVVTWDAATGSEEEWRAALAVHCR